LANSSNRLASVMTASLQGGHSAEVMSIDE
jgi:hypothetical protein